MKTNDEFITASDGGEGRGAHPQNISPVNSTTGSDGKEGEKVYTQNMNPVTSIAAAARSDPMLPLSSSSVKFQRFPTKLYAILSCPEYSNIITWMADGKSWMVINPGAFREVVMPRFFKKNNYQSFLRLTNMWGFKRIVSGSSRSSFYHELFIRGQPHLHGSMCLKSKDVKRSKSSTSSTSTSRRRDNTNNDPDDNKRLDQSIESGMSKETSNSSIADMSIGSSCSNEEHQGRMNENFEIVPMISTSSLQEVSTSSTSLKPDKNIQNDNSILEEVPSSSAIHETIQSNSNIQKIWHEKQDDDDVMSLFDDDELSEMLD